MLNLKTASREALVKEIEGLRRQVSSLQSSSQAGQLRSIVGLDEKVIQLDENINIEYVNTSLAKLMGLKREQIIGKPISAVDNFKWGRKDLLRRGQEEIRLRRHQMLLHGGKGPVPHRRPHHQEDAGTDF
ncbi:MAG: PAS domain-containing protein [Planctomycetota bacterium]|jgi:PAS domain-containing protein